MFNCTFLSLTTVTFHLFKTNKVIHELTFSWHCNTINAWTTITIFSWIFFSKCHFNVAIHRTCVSVGRLHYFHSLLPHTDSHRYLRRINDIFSNISLKRGCWVVNTLSKYYLMFCWHWPCSKYVTVMHPLILPPKLRNVSPNHWDKHQLNLLSQTDSVTQFKHHQTTFFFSFFVFWTAKGFNDAVSITLDVVPYWQGYSDFLH